MHRGKPEYIIARVYFLRRIYGVNLDDKLKVYRCGGKEVWRSHLGTDISNHRRV